ncbi:uncharacterized protein LOC120279327 [Dioscorea cayenensis subsp. rotundata]|uniref:Uncharacterized protein LOC120279327 n=1 Tax=Dioscorea cayennensis subsp. rotundata TaxID=55577 RepID=A0AB40CSS7_DIOCR|nr:uncharacterized protein LOC120279327 [Dioscorea cayenensis subsp. rotundata]
MVIITPTLVPRKPPRAFTRIQMMGASVFCSNWSSCSAWPIPCTSTVSSLSFLFELLQNANFRNAMAHPGNKELAHRQQYFFWKHYKNKRLKHILPRPLPEPALPGPAPAPAPAPAAALVPVPASAPPPIPSQAQMPSMVAAAPAPSMQFLRQPVSALPKADMRNNMGDWRKRKY